MAMRRSARHRRRSSRNTRIGLLLLTLFAGCGEHRPTGPGPDPGAPDTLAPVAVTDLRAIGITPASVALAWTAPGDDGPVGRAAGYALGYSVGPLTDGSWREATFVRGLKEPSAAGSAESTWVDNLQPGYVYSFAVRSIDESLNRSPLSNVVTADFTTPVVAAGALAVPGSWSSGSEFPWSLSFFGDGRMVVVQERAQMPKFPGSPGSIRVLTPEGRELSHWDVSAHPGGCAAGPSGIFYVTFPDQHFVQKRSDTGEVLAQWGDPAPNRPGWFEDPRDLTTDDDGFVYVTDEGNNRIQRFAPTGAFEAEWSCESPVGIATDGLGVFYVSHRNPGAGSVTRFSGEGAVLGRWDSLTALTDLEVAPDGTVLGLRSGTPAIQRTSSTGVHLDAWPVAANARDFAVASDGTLQVLHSTSPNNPCTVTRYSSAGAVLGSWSAPYATALEVDERATLYLVGRSQVTICSGDGIILDRWSDYPAELFSVNDMESSFVGEGELLVLNPHRRRILRFGRDGRLLSGFGSDWNEPGLLSRPAGIAVDSRGRVYVADAGDHRIEVFTSNGEYLRRWDAVGGTGTGAADPRGVAVDAADRIYVWNVGSNLVSVHEPDGVLLDTWPAADAVGTLGARSGEMPSWPDGLTIAGISVAADGSIHLLDAARDRVVAFEPDGSRLGTWGGRGTELGRLKGPTSLAFGPAGDAWVPEYGNNRIQRFILARRTDAVRVP